MVATHTAYAQQAGLNLFKASLYIIQSSKSILYRIANMEWWWKHWKLILMCLVAYWKKTIIFMSMMSANVVIYCYCSFCTWGFIAQSEINPFPTKANPWYLATFYGVFTNQRCSLTHQKLTYSTLKLKQNGWHFANDISHCRSVTDVLCWFPMVQQALSCHWFGWCLEKALMPVRSQAITWTGNEPVHIFVVFIRQYKIHR